MTIIVVEFFKMIDVHHHDRNRLSVGRVLLLGEDHFIVKGPSIAHERQGVSIGLDHVGLYLPSLIEKLILRDFQLRLQLGVRLQHAFHDLHDRIGGTRTLLSQTSTGFLNRLTVCLDIEGDTLVGILQG